MPNIQFDPDRVINYKQIMLSATLLHAKRILPSYLGKLNVSFEPRLSETGEDLVLQLRAYFYGAKDSIKVPASWWDHFKEAKFPAWALKKWPVKYRTINCQALFPDLPFDEKMPHKVIHYISES